ncbi:hypothetical protein [Paenarthrobacter sp. YIM B13468]|uniref:hypothetical protein n=1 Tax=Paenarthrobacter sp. YIM B13468 TaxID=3366295 RepID=UPI00366F3D42
MNVAFVIALIALGGLLPIAGLSRVALRAYRRLSNPAEVSSSRARSPIADLIVGSGFSAPFDVAQMP